MKKFINVRCVKGGINMAEVKATVKPAAKAVVAKKAEPAKTVEKKETVKKEKK